MREKSNYPRLTSKLLALSTADDYEEAKLEWRITGNVWRKSAGHIPDHPSGHNNFCLCGHPIVYHFEIENTKTSTLEIVGSSCISNWMVLRHMSEKLKIDKRTITEKMIEEWKQTAVQTLIKDSWWNENGVDFIKEFKSIADLDLRINVKHTDKKYWDETFKEYRPQTFIRKSSNGTFGHPDYEMASIVWRWNHPDNKKCQKDSRRGIPNERLLNDMSLFYLNIKNIVERVSIEHNIDATRIRNLGNIDRHITEQILKVNSNDLEQLEFLRGCIHFGIRPFTTGEATTSWERRFLRDMRRYVREQRRPSMKQIETLIKILRRTNYVPLADKES
tara:strand:- start:225 stop:1223 length:999 start_codon:yes stop_codon:yes gene_type:complete